MRVMRTVGLLALVGLAFGFQTTATSMTEKNVKQLSWITGAWVEDRPDGTRVEEYWTPVRAGIMIGAGRTSRGEKLLFFEHLRIEQTGDDAITYFAMPKARAATPFKMVEMSDERVVFENLEHDFPQRISYAREGTDGLHARIENKQGDKREEWHFKRMR